MTKLLNGFDRIFVWTYSVLQGQQKYIVLFSVNYESALIYDIHRNLILDFTNVLIQ